jgi:ubiquinone/menaquinone biosynthesis C-methylase UbiE
LEAPATLIGVDLSPGMVSEAARLFPTAEFRVGSFFEIPAVSGSFDIVIVSSAFHHIPDEALPEALAEIHRVLDEHGILVGREPLSVGRLGDRGGWLGGALMNLRHMAYRLTHTREYPEPDPGPAHHAYDANSFLDMIEQVFNPMKIEFRNPVSLFLARVRHPVVAQIAKILDESIGHREGQEIFYAARKNFAAAEDVVSCVRLALKDNNVQDISEFLALLEAASRHIERELKSV